MPPQSALEGEVRRLAAEVQRLKQLVAVVGLALCDHFDCDEFADIFDRMIEWASVEFDPELADELLPVLPKIAAVPKVAVPEERRRDQQKPLFGEPPEPDE